MGARIVGVVCSAILVGSFAGAGIGCSSNDTEVTATSPAAIQAASVALTLHDENGTRVGEGSGILIAPRLVLTAAHLVSGNTHWMVKTADGTTAKGVRGLTYDWMTYNSNKSHPRKHDVAVIYLDKPIKLDVYPKLASSHLADGTKSTRIRGTGNGFEEISTTIGSVGSFPHAYLTDFPNGETLDTGGAVLNDKNDIVGVVTGRGTTTGKLYIARTDALTAWISPKAVCAGTTTSVRTYGTPGGSSGGTSGTSGGTSGTSGNPDGTSGGTSGTSGNTSGGTSGTDTPSPTCNGDGGGNCYGDCTSGSNPSGGSSGSYGLPPAGSSGWDGTPTGTNGSSGGTSGTSGTTSSGGASGTNGNPSDGSSGASGTSGGGGTTSGGASGTNNNPTGGGAGGSATNSGSGTGELCSGESDNPEVCPPEPKGCVGAACGGGQPDESIEYGGCLKCTSSGSNPVVK